MPTDDTVNASGSDADTAHQTSSEITDDLIVSHPKYKELEEKHAAARNGMDQSNLSKKELQAEVARLRVLAGVEEAEVKKDDEPQTVTKAELQEQIWELKHAEDVELYGDSEYKADIENGIPKEYALKTAKLRFQSNPDKARLDRQQTMASGSNSSVRNLDANSYEGFNEEEAKRYGYTKETWLEHKKLKEARGRI